MDDFGKVHLYSPEDVVRCSFMVQKSLTPLDLNTLEYCYLALTPFTEEGFQKLYGVEDRRVLFEYNLDVSHGLEKALKEHDPVFKFGTNKFESSVYRGVILPANYYYKYIHHDIVEAIEKSRDKIAKLKEFLPLMKMMQVSSKSLGGEKFDFFARVLQEECTDSKLVAEVVEVLGKIHFNHFLLRNFCDMEYMEYFLYHMQNMKIQMQFETDYCPVSRSLFMRKFQRAIALIKYGKMRPPLIDEDISYYISTFCCFTETARNWIKWKPRYYYEDEDLELCADNLSCVKKLLFLLLVSVFCYQVEYKRPRSYLLESQKFESPGLGIQALRLMSQSLPESYLTLSEIQSVWNKPDGYLDQPTADQVYSLYKTEIMDRRNKDLDIEEPRTLLHLARCEIRRQLAGKFALPDKIQLLGLPQPIQEFLSLKI